jgi:hypothetical protein
MPARAPREALLGQIKNLVGFAFAAGVFLMQGAVNWVRGERLLTFMVIFTAAWLVFGVVVVSRRILKAIPN